MPMIEFLIVAGILFAVLTAFEVIIPRQDFLVAAMSMRQDSNYKSMFLKHYGFMKMPRALFGLLVVVMSGLSFCFSRNSSIWSDVFSVLMILFILTYACYVFRDIGAARRHARQI